MRENGVNDLENLLYYMKPSADIMVKNFSSKHSEVLWPFFLVPDFALKQMCAFLIICTLILLSY